MGANMWSFKTEAQVAWKPIKRLTWEIGGNFEIFTENDDYKMGNKLQKDTRYVLLSHLSWDFTDYLFMSGSIHWTKGAETEVNGVRSNNEVDTKNVMFTTGVRVNPTSQILFQIAHDFDVKMERVKRAIRFSIFFFC